jgi:hypothetical protein
MPGHFVMDASPRGGNRLSPIAALAAGEAYSIYATFFGHALGSPSVYLVDRYTHRRLLPGQIGDIEEALHWSDLIWVLAVSLIIFILVWWGVSIALRCAYKPESGGATSPQEMVAHPASQRTGHLIVRPITVQNGVPPAFRREIESRCDSTTAEYRAPNRSNSPERIMKPSIVLEAAWEITDPPPKIMAIDDSNHFRIRTANISASSLKIARSKALSHYHNSERLQRTLQRC